MNRLKYYQFLGAVLVMTIMVSNISCKKTQQQPKSTNPPMEGFNRAESDSTALAIADRVMEALGGRKNWDNTHYISWRFFGKRFHLWDKWSGNLRFEDRDLVVLMNVNTQQGRAWRSDREITAPDTLQNILRNTYATWVNDSYWMFMPFKLKDTGVTLKYKGKGHTKEGRQAEILELTFSKVGVTPQNKYQVYIDPHSYLPLEWSYFAHKSDKDPMLVTPWKKWKRYGNILLSNDRGNGRQLTDIAIYDSLPDRFFTSPHSIDLTIFQE